MTSIFSRGGFQILVVCLLVAGCRKAGQTVLGKDPSGERQLIAAIIAENTSRPIMIAGVIVEKCPVAGCWFKLQDETGTIKVDTKSAGFAVVEVPVQAKVVVAGKLTRDGNQLILDASGLRY